MSSTPDGSGSGIDRGDGFEREREVPRRPNPTDKPGIFLMVIGILSLIGAIWTLIQGMQLYKTPADVYKRQVDEQLEATKKMFPQVEITGQDFDADGNVKTQAHSDQLQHGRSGPGSPRSS